MQAGFNPASQFVEIASFIVTQPEEPGLPSSDASPMSLGSPSPLAWPSVGHSRCFSGSPSSSTVLLPIPGKSILKKLTTKEQSLISRWTTKITAGLGSDSSIGLNSEEKLKRAHSILPEIVIVYPIFSMQPPSTPALKRSVLLSS